MNIDNIATTIPVETIPIENRVPAAPVSQPDKVDIQEKINTQKIEDSRKAEKAAQKNNFSSEDTKHLAAELNEIMADLQTNLGFSIREDLHNTVVVEIKNQKTNELIRQIPSEELLIIKEKMMELTGLIFDHSV